MKKIMLLTVFVSFLLKPTLAISQSDHPDYAALEALYNATNGDWWWENTNWLTEEPISTWHGITVNENNRVSELNLEWTGLSGSLPDAIGDLEMLKVLNLNFSFDMTGNIPASIVNLIHLEEISLGSCNLYGDIPDLTTLNLNVLNIDGNKFQFGDFEDEFSSYMSNIPKFYYSFQSGEYFPPQTVMIGDNITLETIVSGSSNLYTWYKYNNYDLEIIEGETTPLLAFNDFQNSDGGSYACVVTSPLIPDLEITWDFDIQPPASASPDYDALMAFYNAMGGPDWYDNSNWLDPNVPLKSWNGIVEVNQDNRVVNLSFFENNLSGSIPNMTDFEALERITFYGNNISGAIPPEIGQLSNLTWLELSENQLSGEIPMEIGQLSNLQNLRIIETQVGGSIPSEIGDLTNLQTITLYDNNFSGKIPIALCHIPNLAEIDFRYNQLSGNIPDEIGNLSNLDALLLGSNELSGEIPETIGNLSNLGFLQLFRNQLSGEIPEAIGNLSNLQIILLFGNNLSGSIPKEIGNLNQLSALVLSRNNLTGEIPAEIGNLTNLYDLDLSYNDLSGSIPKELGNLSNLALLEFWSNNLSGTIPEELGNLTYIQRLGIGNNQLTGPVPDSFSNLQELWRLDLEVNQLSGPLPDLTNLPLEVFFLGSNNFVFSDFEDQFNHFYNTMGNYFFYTPMNPFDEFEIINEVTPPTEDVELTTLFYNNSNASPNNSYQWYKNYEPISGATSPNYLIENALTNDTGEYMCLVTNSVVTGLTLERNPYVVNIIDRHPNPTDVVFKMFPNPTNSTFQIKSETVTEGFLEIYDFQGVLSYSDYFSSEYYNNFDISHLNRGIYIVKLSTFYGETYYNKLVKK